ncbi:hypothetical protein D9M71_364220 [compost metagenome]
MQRESITLMNAEAHCALGFNTEQYHSDIVFDHVERRGLAALFSECFKHRVNRIPQPEGRLVNLSQTQGLMTHSVLPISQAPDKPGPFQ